MAPDLTGLSRTPAGGWRVYVRVRPYTAVRRLPKGTTQRQALAVRDALRAELRGRRAAEARLTPTAGTFAADVARYLDAVAGMPTIRSRAWLMARWVEVFGPRCRRDITAAEIRRALADWQRHYSARTLLLLRGALRHLWHVLDGRAASNPVRDVPPPRAPDDLPRAIPLPAVVRILRGMRPSRSRAVLWLMATTGLPPSDIARLRPEDWHGATVIAHGRRKGRGTRPRTLPLSRHGQAALRSMARMQAWGGVGDSLRATWREAKARAGYADRPWRVYDLRHTYLTEMARFGDDAAVAYLAGHSRLDMVRRYTLGAVPDRVARLVASVVATRPTRPRNGEEIGAKSAPAGSPARPADPSENRPDSASTPGESDP